MANTTQIKGNKTTDGDLTANAFITSGGVSTDFVKGDGTLDSNTYLSTSLTEGQFLRSDVADTKTAGDLTISENVFLRFGTTHSTLGSTAVQTQLNLVNQDFKILDNSSTRFTFGRTTGDLTNTGNIISQGTGDNSFVGNVGIGTTSPGTMLSIYDSTARMELNDTDGTSQLAYIEHSNGITGIISRNNTSNGKFQIRGWNGTATTNFVTVDASGNVGIGTAAPSSKLHVLGTTSTEKLQIFNVALAETFFEVGDGEIGSILYSMERSPSGGVTNEIALKAEFGPLTLWGGSGGTPTRVMSLLNSGNVGIGTTAPNQKLTVKGNDNYIATESSTVIWGAANTIGVRMGTKSANEAGNIDFRRWTGTANDHDVVRISQDARIGGVGAWGLGFFADGLSTNTAASTLRMIIDPDNGNIGIGTDNPTKKFEVHSTDIVQGVNNGAFEFRATSNYGSSKNLLYHRQDVNQLTFNEDGADLDFRFEGTTNSNLLFIDAGTDSVGIGAGGSNNFVLNVTHDADGVAAFNTSSTTGNPYIALQQAGTRRSYIQHVDSGDKLRINSQYGAMEFMTDSAGTGILRMTIDSSGDVEMKGNLIWAQTLLNKTASYALLAADIGTCLTTSGASNINFTVNTGSMTAIGHTIEVDHAGTGTCTIVAGASVTLQINSNDTLVLDGQYSRVMIQKMAGTNTFRVFGQLTPA